MREDLFKNPFADLEDKADPLIPSACLQIYKHIESDLNKDRAEPSTANRCSSATMCVKRRWYQNQGFVGKPLTPRKLINFMLGDLSERTMQYFIRKACVGPGKLYSEVDFGEVVGTFEMQGKDVEVYRQKDLHLTIPNCPAISGHADGFGKRNSDGCWELIECKSAANFGFKKFQHEGPDDYLKQAHAVMLTDEAQELGVASVRFFYLRKETGHLWDRLFHFDQALARQVKFDFLASNATDEPLPDYDFVPEMVRKKPTGRATIPWQCQYCPFLERCKGECKMEWKADQWGNQKPVYIFPNNKEFENAV